MQTVFYQNFENKHKAAPNVD